jgi:hypothetical protein
MKLFKIILFFFAIYFIRRFMQFYRVVEKRGQDLRRQEEETLQNKKADTEGAKVVEAEYKVIDDR